MTTNITLPRYAQQQTNDHHWATDGLIMSRQSSVTLGRQTDRRTHRQTDDDPWMKQVQREKGAEMRVAKLKRLNAGNPFTLMSRSAYLAGALVVRNLQFHSEFKPFFFLADRHY